MTSSTAIVHKPSFVSRGNHRFLIMDAPTDYNLPAYIEEFKKYNVRVVIRACNPTYSTTPLNQNHIDLVEMPFPDGAPPPQHVVSGFLDTCKRVFDGSSEEAPTVAVHCVAGLGRAPVLVAIDLIEQGMDAMDAVELIRKMRRGAINARQLAFLEQYRPSKSSHCSCALL